MKKLVKFMFQKLEICVLKYKNDKRMTEIRKYAEKLRTKPI